MYCVQWNREDNSCETFNDINNCPNFPAKLEAYGIACRHSYPWRTRAIEKYLGRKLYDRETANKLIEGAAKL
jgi:hypothetical protein